MLIGTVILKCFKTFLLKSKDQNSNKSKAA